MTKSAASLEPLHDRSRLTDADAITLLEGADLSAMMEVAATLRDRGHASIVSFSKKVFIRSPSFAETPATIARLLIRRRARRAPILAPTKFWRSRRLAPRLAVTRRCSRSATSPSDGIEKHGRSWPHWATKRLCPISGR